MVSQTKKKFNREHTFHSLSCILVEIEALNNSKNQPKVVKRNLNYLKQLINKYI